MALLTTKADPALGKKVRERLEKVGLETPMIENELTLEQRRDVIKSSFEKIMVALGLDLSDDSLTDTPRRVAKMYVDEIFAGLNYDLFPKCTSIEDKFKTDSMIAERNVTVMSACEHHFVTIDGSATIAYIPNKKVIGLSKMNRIVEFFARRPQVQERLTGQIHEALCFILETNDVAVMIDASHYCVKSRGVEDSNSSTVTSKLSGAFKENHETRNEFLQIAKGYK